MNILVDFSQIPIKKTGVGNYTLNILKRIVRQRRHMFFVVVQDDDKELDVLAGDNVTLIRIPSRFFRKIIFRSFMEQLIFPYFVKKNAIDVIHSLHYSFPLISAGAKRVVNIYDMTFFKMPEYHVKVKVFYFKAFIKLATKYADAIITTSKSTLRDMNEITGVDAKKVGVIYHGAEFSESLELNPQTIDETKNKYGIKGEYILFIGTIEPRKNLTKLIKAFKKLLSREDTYSLVIVGQKGWYYENIYKTVSTLNLDNKVIFTGFVDEKEKPLLIKGSKIFVYPSMYEGFGIPVLESMSLGIPTVTSNISSLPEVGGKAALLINPKNVDEIYTAMMTLVKNNDLYTETQQRSLEQASRFSWDKSARKTLNVYELF